MAVPKPVPTTLKILRGNPGKRALPKPGEEPMPEVLSDLGEPPEYIGEYGALEWYRAGPILIQLGLLTHADLTTFVAYCLNVNLMIEAQKDIKDNGMTVMGKNGRVRNPALAAFSQATTALRALAAEFGMTPSSRARMRLPGDDGEDLGDILGDTGPEDVS